MAEIVTIYESRIAGLFSPGAAGDAFMRRFLGDTSSYARALAPRRTSELANSHRTLGPVRRGRYGLRGQVVNTADYAAFVHNGTTGPITSTRPNGWMRLPPSGRAAVLDGPNAGPVYRRSVRGQRANPWLDRAGTLTARRYLAGGYVVNPIYM